jgi:hypothetical protein
MISGPAHWVTGFATLETDRSGSSISMNQALSKCVEQGPALEGMVADSQHGQIYLSRPR